MLQSTNHFGRKYLNNYMPLTQQQKKDLIITDLETYTMASEEAIDAKLEALEMRMEDRIYALFAKFNSSLYWHYDKPSSRDHYCKKGRLLMIKLVEEEDLMHEEENLDYEEEDVEEEPQSSDCLMHALTGYVNPQIMKIGGLLKHQLIIVLINTGSTNNFLNSMAAARMVLRIEDCSKFDVKVTDGRILK
ncbi:hypothetical protein BHE74_00008240 [Ensete ventricosum]|nr:hypothetical protein BHE74_00008240 [Ensete ventricosum]RZR86307.1 hypothetical protein BHM03_00013487 [Ensete ventricosum]